MNEYELYHHGVKGQKWGVRRTAAQLGHRVASAARTAGKAVGKGAAKAGKAAKRAAIAKAKQSIAENKEKRYYKKLHKKKLSQMTDKEIKDLTDRVKREAGLKDAEYESRMQNARKFYNNVAKKPLETTATVFAKAAAENMFKNNNSNNNSNDGDDKSKTDKSKTDKSKTDKSKTDKPAKNTDTPTVEVEVVSDKGGASAGKGIKVQKWGVRKEKATNNTSSASDFDAYFESEVAKQYKKDHKKKS